ncbi:aspartate carbamoyltransferase [Ferroacidibacillus organovorans]|nr:aspartate carbamoyltransferase [Ferroacidibacillus organovorans]
MKHVISAKSFSREALEALLATAGEMRVIQAQGGADFLSHKVMAALFFEPSTRTRLSFETAMLRLNGRVISTENAKEFSSAVKGETLEDTIRVVAGYADVIVLRHPEIGAAARAAEVSSVPVLSAGDGAGEHPTQALLDMFTILTEVGRLDDLTVTLVGDLLYGRTVHSLVYLLSLFRDVRIVCTAPAAIPLPADVIAYAKARGVHVSFEPDLSRAAKKTDVLYQTRVQKERFPTVGHYEAVRANYVIDTRILSELPPHSIIMHPLPRAGEIDPGVDRDPRAAYFRQSHYGVPVRMAVLKECFTSN